MAEDGDREHSERSKVQRAERHAEGANAGQGGLETAPAALSGSMLGDPRLNGRGNAPVRVAMMQRMQRTYGNRAVQRSLQRAMHSRSATSTDVGKGIGNQEHKAQGPAGNATSELSAASTVPTQAMTTTQVMRAVEGLPLQRLHMVQRVDASSLPVQRAGNPVGRPMAGTSIHPTVRRGDTGAAVEELQQKLTAAGFPPRARVRLVMRTDVVGTFGAGTEQALRRFQGRNSLTVDGVAGNSTWAKMDELRLGSTVGRVERQWQENVGGVTYEMSSANGHTSRYTWRITGNEIKITVNLQFTGPAAGTAPIAAWLTHMKSVWNRFKMVNSANRQEVNIVFDPQSVTSNADNVVNVQPGNNRSDAATWYAGAPNANDVAAHEFGHMVGLEDEYQRTHRDYKRLTGREPARGATTNARSSRRVAAQLRAALLVANQATRITRANNVITSNGLVQGNFAQRVATAYRSAHSINVVDDIVARIPAANQWAIVDPFTHSNQTIMGLGGDHAHPIEARHVREFAEYVRRARPGTWRTRPI